MTHGAPGRAVIGLAACALSVAYVFRFQLASGFDTVSGDIYDGRIETALLEHWFNVFCGWEGWRQPLFFSPRPDTLGYNDGYLLFGVVYSGFRWLGCDPFLAGDLVHAVMRAAGFWAFMLFACATCRLPWACALLGATLFTIANGAYMQIGHAQLLTLGLAPLLGWLACSAAEAQWRGDAGQAAVRGIGAAILFDLWLMTAFYMLWFTAFFGVVMAAVALARLAARPGAAWRRVLALPRWPLVASGAVLLAGMAPFALTYLPTARETGMHPFSEVLPLLPTPMDLVNYGAGSLIYGRLDTWLGDSILLPGEHTVGIPLLLLGLGLWGAAAAWRDDTAADRHWWQAMAAALAVSLLLCLRVGPVAPWWLVYSAVPGAAAVRAVTRFLLFLTLPTTLLAMHVLGRRPMAGSRGVLALLALMLVIEEANGQTQAALPRTRELAFLRRLPPVPAACRVFFVAGPRPEHPQCPSFTVNIDAMLVAELVHRPTLNGHASFLPKDFHMGFTDAADYRRQVVATALEAGLDEGLCSLDLVRLSWTPMEIPQLTPPIDAAVDLGGTGDAAAGYLGAGWSGAEPQGRWTDGAAADLVFASPARGQDLTLALVASGFAPGGAASPVTVLANGQAVARWRPTAAQQTLAALIPASLATPDGHIRLRLVIARPASPLEARLGSDARKLGLFVHSFTLHKAGGPAAPSG